MTLLGGTRRRGRDTPPEERSWRDGNRHRRGPAGRPSPVIEVTVLRKNAGDAEGVVAVVVPPSLNAPHESDGRFPVRSGPTTRYMTEPEISGLYAQRRRFIEEASGSRIPLEEWTPPEGVTAGSGFGGVGRMELLVQPLASVAHPLGYRLKKPLEEALKRAEVALSPKMHEAPRTLSALWRWEPRATVGWKAGSASTDFTELVAAGVLVAATISYPARMSTCVTMSIDHGNGREAFEHLWMREAIGLLQFAGEFYSDIPGVGLLRCELRLSNLDNAVSSIALHKLSKAHVPIAESAYVDGRLFSSHELRIDAPRCATEMLERLLISFVPDGVDVLAQSGVTTT